MRHTSHIAQLIQIFTLFWSLGLTLEAQCQLFLENRESVRGSRGGARFALPAHSSSLYLDGCLSIIVSVHDLLCALVSQLSSASPLVVYRIVVHQFSGCLQSMTLDREGCSVQLQSQQKTVQIWCLDQTLLLVGIQPHGLQRQPAGGDSPILCHRNPPRLDISQQLFLLELLVLSTEVNDQLDLSYH